MKIKIIIFLILFLLIPSKSLAAIMPGEDLEIYCKRDFKEEGQLADIKRISAETLNAFYEEDIEYLDSVISEEGLYITYAETFWQKLYGKETDFLPIRNFLGAYNDRNKKQEWYADGDSGVIYNLSLRDYLQDVFFITDFRKDRLVSYDQRIAETTDIWNFDEAYPEGFFIEYQAKEALEGTMNFIRLVFVLDGDEFRLSAISRSFEWLETYRIEDLVKDKHCTVSGDYLSDLSVNELHSASMINFYQKKLKKY